MNKRLRWAGGNQEGRFIEDKLKSLKKALLYSYQAATAVLEDGREFRCLINPDKLKPQYDNKIISIPYKDICLNKPRVGTTTMGEEEIGLKPGDVFQWKETETYWLVYLQYLEEDAYFRAELRRADYEVEINGHKYRVYIRGPVETTIQWNQKKGILWNNLNYSLEMYITQNEETLEYFHRFQKIKVKGKPWEVKTVDSFDADGIIQIMLGETYTNELEDEMAEVVETETPETSDPGIKGPNTVNPFDVVTYEIYGSEDYSGSWEVSNPRMAKVVKADGPFVTIEIITGKSGNFELKYNSPELTTAYPIKVNSL